MIQSREGRDTSDDSTAPSSILCSNQGCSVSLSGRTLMSYNSVSTGDKGGFKGDRRSHCFQIRRAVRISRDVYPTKPRGLPAQSSSSMTAISPLSNIIDFV